MDSEEPKHSRSDHQGREDSRLVQHRSHSLPHTSDQGNKTSHNSLGENGNKNYTRLRSLTESGRNKTGESIGSGPRYGGFLEVMSQIWIRLRNFCSPSGDSYFSRRESRSQSIPKCELTDEQKMRLKLEYHFMTPFQKYKRGRKPWKLGIQVLKILLVTTQVSLFGTDRFSSVSFFQHSKRSFEFLFIKDWAGDSALSYYSKDTVAQAINFANDRYLHIGGIALGVYTYIDQKNESFPPPPMQFCSLMYRKAVLNASSEEFHYDLDTINVCEDINETSINTITQKLYDLNFFKKVVNLQMHFSFDSIYLAGLKFHHKPECFRFKIMILMDNAKNDGRIRVGLKTWPSLITCSSRFRTRNDALAISGVLVAFDAVVIFVCAVSCALCIRSLIKSIMLAKKAKRYFKEHLQENLTNWDMFEFINKWFPVIVVSDCLSIAGSIYKIFVDERDLGFYNVCCILLGLGVLLVWIGLLRFLAYLKAYNILLITLRVAAPALLRFLLCASFIFFGFTFCGWVVLGPYHEKFREFWVTMECLFSLLNGDDMFPTFASMSDRSTLIWIFSKFYVYVFVSFFIYITLSTFISIVGDTYERLKDWGRLPPTRIEQFIDGKKRDYSRQHATLGGCHRCARSHSPSRAPTPVPPIPGLSSSIENSLGALSTSQVSLVSASWE